MLPSTSMPSTSSYAQASSPQSVSSRKFSPASDTSSVESFSSSNGSDSVAVKPVKSFARKMKAEARPFVSRYCDYSHPVTSPVCVDVPQAHQVGSAIEVASQSKVNAAKGDLYGAAKSHGKQPHFHPTCNGKGPGRYQRRPVGNKGQHQKHRHHSGATPPLPTNTSYYPCAVCYHGFTSVDYRDARARDPFLRNRSYSASQASVHSADSANSITKALSLAECSYLYTNYRKRSSLYNLTSEDMHILTIGRSEFDLHDTRFDVLTFDQVLNLKEVLEQTVTIQTDPEGNGDVVSFPLMDLVLAVRDRLLEKGINLYDIRLNGGAASHVLSMSASVYNDIDLIFSVDLPETEQYELVREAVLEVLLDFMPPTICEKRRIIEHIVNKMVKIQEQDRWSLISLVNSGGRNVELKFVDHMRRQYEFSVDSFQIVLDTLLTFCTVVSDKHPMTINFYPTVVGESMYGNYSESIVHLHHRLIVTKSPEEIRGGGLLKYCSLLVRKFTPIDEESVKVLEPYMCTRFLIDFIYQDCHRTKLTNYLRTHFDEDTMLKYNFLVILQATVRRSSSLASHHASALVIFEDLIVETYSQLLLEYFNLYLTNVGKLQDFFARCQEMRQCHCPKSLNRQCIHRYLNALYAVTAPIVVTYVDDPASEMTTKEERKANLAHFIDAHDELYPVYGGYTFAFLPASLFDNLESNHYVISSSTLKSISSARFVAPDPPSADFLCTFLMKPASAVNPMIQIIPLAVQHLLPKSFYPIDYEHQNLITPGLAYHFFPPISPPPSYRLCIVNRIPIYYSQTIASGPIFNSQIMSMHYQSPPAPPTIPAATALDPLFAHVHHHSTHGHAHHAQQHAHHGHGHGPHGSYQLYQQYPQQVSYLNGNGRSKKGSGGYYGHQHQHGAFHSHSHYQQQMSLPAGHSESLCSPPVEPLRIVYPRIPAAELTAQQQQAVTSGMAAAPEQSQLPQLHSNGKGKGKGKAKQVIPAITVNDSPINLNSDVDWPAPGEEYPTKPAKQSSRKSNPEAKQQLQPRPGSSYSAAAAPNPTKHYKASTSVAKKQSKQQVTASA